MFRRLQTRVVVFTAGIIAIILLAPVTSSAQTVSATLDVSATVTKACTVSATPLSFGAYDSSTALAVAANATLVVTCTRGTVATISMSDGANSIVPQIRRMAAGGEFLAYDLFQDAALTTRWGASGQAMVWTAPNSSNNGLTVYGQISAGQDVPAGAYTDQVQVTINY
jgi:spore coat protein U-like protein